MSKPESGSKSRQTPAPRITEEEQRALDTLETNSSRIRYLYERGYVPGQIRTLLNLKHYQNVRNVIVAHEKKKRERAKRESEGDP